MDVSRRRCRSASGRTAYIVAIRIGTPTQTVIKAALVTARHEQHEARGGHRRRGKGPPEELEAGRESLGHRSILTHRCIDAGGENSTITGGPDPVSSAGGDGSVVSVGTSHASKGTVVSQNADLRARPVTVRLARWSATHPWRAIAALARVRHRQRRHRQHRRTEQAQQHRPDVRSVQASGSVAARLRTRVTRQRERPRDRAVGPVGRTGGGPGARRGGRPPARPAAGRFGRQSDHRGRPIGDDAAGHAAPTTPGPAHCWPRRGRCSTTSPTYESRKSGSVSLGDAINNQVGSDLSAAATFSVPVTLADPADRLRRHRGGRRPGAARAVRGRVGDRPGVDRVAGHAERRTRSRA